MLLAASIKQVKLVPAKYACVFHTRHFGTSESRRSDVVKREPLDMSFNNAKIAHNSQTNWELFRAYFVFRMMSFDTIVRNQQQLQTLGRRILGRRLFNWFMKNTFYGHFVGGESEETVKPVVERLRSFGVKAILDYSSESDLDENAAKKVEMAALTSRAKHSPKEEEVVGGKLAQFQPGEAIVDRRYKSTARTYFYLNEAQCEKNMDIFLRCIDAVAGTTGLAAIKMTALGRPHLLMQLSEVIVHTRKYFKEVTGKPETMALAEVSPSTLQDKLHIDKDQQEFKKWIDGMDYDKKGLMNIFCWSGLVDMNMVLSDMFKVPNLHTGRMEPIMSALTPEEEEMFGNMMRRLHAIAKHATERDVRVMVDAEQTYFQPAISRITVELMRKYNKSKPVMFNTYQNYLRDALDNVRRDIELSKRQNFHFAAKIVRGAYMDQERLRAKALGYPDPINPSYEATNEMYHKTLDYILEEITKSADRKISVMVCSHNEDTIRYAVQQMKKYNIAPDQKLVCFGQLLGMCDQVSFPLGQAGYSVYKYVPYGPIDEVMPYLSRRAVENNSLLKKVSKELTLLRREIFRRILTGKWFYRPNEKLSLLRMATSGTKN